MARQSEFGVLVQAAKLRILVLYTHPILGEGLANLLTAQAGVGAVAVDGNDAAARRAALSTRPDLIIVEETEAARSFETRGSLPVVFVRVDGSGRRRVGSPLANPEDIVALARGFAEGRTSTDH